MSSLGWKEIRGEEQRDPVGASHFLSGFFVYYGRQNTTLFPQRPPAQARPTCQISQRLEMEINV